MKKAPSVRLSLRKLMVAMLAVGPLAILPSPVWAALPVIGNITAVNGTVSLVTITPGVSIAINTSDRAVLVWGPNTFNIATGEEYRFEVPNGSVLNKIGYNATINGGLAAPDTATINGTLRSSGRVFVLANGNIVVGPGAQINTVNGLVLSTLQETSDNPFTSAANLSFAGNSTGSITIGGAATRTNVNQGSLSLWSGNIAAIDNIQVSNDLIVNSTSGTVVNLSGATGSTLVTGNLSVTTNNGGIAQGTAPLLVSSGVTTLRTNNGTAAVVLDSTGNDFRNVTLNTAGSVNLTDTSDITLNASTVGGVLTVKAGSHITTGGAVAVGSANLNAASGDILFGNGSSVSAGGTISAAANSGNVTINTVGNVTTGAIRAGTVTAGGAITTSLTSGGTGYTGVPTVTFSTVPGGSGATATATVNTTTGQVTGITITSSGTGYSAAPTITLVGGGALPSTVATANTTLNADAVAAVNVVTGGSGYTAAPTVTFAGGTPGTGATATAELTGNVVTGFNLTAPGSGYLTAPSVTLIGGGINPGNTAVVSTALSASSGIAGGNVTINTTGTATIAGAIGPVNNVTVTAPTISATGGAIGTTSTPASGVTLSATSSIELPSIAASSLNVTSTGGSISQIGGSVLAIGNSTATFNAGTAGNITLGGSNAFANTVITSTANSLTINNTGPLILGRTIATGNVTINTTAAPATIVVTGAGNTSSPFVYTATGTGNVIVGTGSGTAVQGITIGGALSISTNAATVTADADAPQDVFGALTINTTPLLTGTIANVVANTTILNGGAVSWNTAWSSPIGTTARFGQVSVNAGIFGTNVTVNNGTGTPANVSMTPANVVLSETTSLNVGNITGNTIVLNSTTGDVLINGQITSNVNNVTTNTNAGVTSLWVRGTGTANTSNVGSITQGSSGNLNVGSARFETNNAGGTSLTSASNSFGGLVTIVNGGNNVIVSGSNIAFSPGNVTGGTVTVNTVGSVNNVVTLQGGNATDVRINSAGQVRIAGGTTRNLTIVANSTAVPVAIPTNHTYLTDYAILQTGNFTSNGTLSLTTPGNVHLNSTINLTNNNIGNAASNITGTVLLANVVGDAVVSSYRNLTVSGSGQGNLTAIAGSGPGGDSFANAWNLILGNLNVKGLTAIAQNGANNEPNSGNSGNITQATGTRLHTDNFAEFITNNGSVVVANNGNNNGRFSAYTGGNNTTAGSGNITYVEDATVKVGNIYTNGTATITSRFGSVIEDPVANVILNVGGVLNVNAPAGSIHLGNLTHTDNTTSTTGNIVGVNLVASGAIQIATSGNLVLGATAANSLSVSANMISQSGPLGIFGSATFNGANGVTLTNPDNNFGPITINTLGLSAPISIVEAQTMNLRSVNMPAGGNGTVSLTSTLGDIIDTGFAGVKLGGNSAGVGGGVVTLNAAAGNINLRNPTTEIATSAGVVFNGNNVTFDVVGSNVSQVVLGAAGQTSRATGNLTVRSALGNITSAGAFTVGGTASFEAFTPGAGVIEITQPGTGFGNLRFNGQQVTISESGSMDILTGSSSFGPAVLSSGSNISIVNVGGSQDRVFFGNTVRFNAGGNIILPKLIQAIGQVTVSHTGTADLSALSIGGDLTGITPVDAGTGTYVAPQP